MFIPLNPEMKKIKFNRIDVVADLIQQIYSKKWVDKNKEHFFTIGLKRNNTLTYVDLASIGTLHSVSVDARLVFKPALIRSASALILLHNHPSESIIPSDSDILLTRNMVHIGRIMDIRILDHIIVGGKNHSELFSFANEGELY